MTDKHGALAEGLRNEDIDFVQRYTTLLVYECKKCQTILPWTDLGCHEHALCRDGLGAKRLELLLR